MENWLHYQFNSGKRHANNFHKLFSNIEFYYLIRLNTPTTPSPVSTPDISRPPSEEKPDLYCVLANMSCPRCAVGCANFKNTLLVCGRFLFQFMWVDFDF